MKLTGDILAAVWEATTELLSTVARLKPRIWVGLVTVMFLVNVFLWWGPSIRQVVSGL
jgi:hypothetical protein